MWSGSYGRCLFTTSQQHSSRTAPEIQPRRYYKRVVLRPGEHITLKPGRLLLGRVHEKFTVPPGYCAELIGRSSFARMGLMIHCTGGYINPGYRGHMPLQLVNHSRNPIKLFPLLPICQLRLGKLTSTPSRLYGESELQSKYMDDDGGPSYWWRDKRVKTLQKALGEVDVSLRMQQEILGIIGEREPEIIERLERLVVNLPRANLENAEALLETFSEKEDRRRFWRKLLLGSAKTSFPILLALSLGSLFSQPIGILHYLSWVLTVLSLPVSLYAFRSDIGDHLGAKEIRQLERQISTSEEHYLPPP